jgi:hypothetical protein
VDVDHCRRPGSLIHEQGSHIHGVYPAYPTCHRGICRRRDLLTALDLLGLHFDLLAWILAFVGAVIGVINIQPYKEWAFIALATLVGALLMVCGIQKLMQLMQRLTGTLLILVLAGVSFTYRGGYFKVAKPATL